MNLGMILLGAGAVIIVLLILLAVLVVLAALARNLR
jgi:hypothetical protein